MTAHLQVLMRDRSEVFPVLRIGNQQGIVKSGDISLFVYLESTLLLSGCYITSFRMEIMQEASTKNNHSCYLKNLKIAR